MTVVLAVVSVSLATWACAGDCTSSGLWKAYVSVGVAVLLALVSQTRDPGWAALARATLGGWMIAAPYALGFAGISPAGDAYPAIGVLVIMTSILRYKRIPSDVSRQA